jgi:hypothetical protein
MPDQTSDSATSAAAVAELQQLLLATDDIDEFLQQLTHVATDVLPGDLSCGVTLRRDHRPITVASRDLHASQVASPSPAPQGCLTTLDTVQVLDGCGIRCRVLLVPRRWDGPLLLGSP